MHQTAALAVEETDLAFGELRAEIQASLALNRAVLQALSSLSAAMAAAADGALDDELQLARRAGLSPRVVELLEDARENLRNEDDARISGLELALLAAADALPDMRPRHEA